MRIKEGFVICQVGGKTVAAASGALSAEFNGMITLNETGKLLFELLQKDTSEQELVQALVLEYGIDEKTAARDVRAFLAPLTKAGVLLS